VLALLATLAGAVAFAAVPARAVDSAAPAARGLRDSRLYLDPAVVRTVDASTRARLRRLLAQRSEPVFVALVAFVSGDAFDGDGPRYLTALAGRLGRPGIYVTYDQRGILWTSGYRVSYEVGGRAGQAARVVDLESSFHSLPGARIASFLAALDDPDLDGRERRADAAFRKRTGSGGGVMGRRTPAGHDDDPSTAMIVLIVAGVVLLAGVAFVLLRRRRGAHHVDDRPLLPGRVIELARDASREELAERAEAMLIGLSGLIDVAPTSSQTRRALDAYEAADRVLRGDEPDVPDLVGALVCIDVGRRALGSGRDEPPPCTYDPRHGPAQGRAVTVDATRLRLCRACRADVAAGRPADVLRDGAGHPYIDDANSPWAASGYGAWSDPVRAVLDRRTRGRL